MKIPHWLFLAGPTLAMGLGCAMNFIVMAANHGQMPVLIPGGDASLYEQDAFHCAMTASSHLKFLADWIVIKDLGVASPGDLSEWLYDATLWPGFIIWATLKLKDSGIL